MGLGRMGSGWLFLLAGVLLAVATTTTAATTGKEEDGATAGAGSYSGSQRICELKCQHWVDLTRRQQCIDFCIKYQLMVAAVKQENNGALVSKDSYGGSQRICELKCQHWVDLVRRQQCIDFCIKYQLAATHVNEHDVATAIKDIYGGSQRICELKCQHWVDLTRRQQCIDFCIKYQLVAAAVKEENTGAIASKDSYGGSQRICELKCQHWVDLARRQQCIDFCIKYQLVAAAVKRENNGAITSKDSYGGSQRICELKCQHWVDLTRRQQCIDFCIKYQLVAATIKQEKNRAIAGKDSYGGSQRICELKCQHWVDLVRRQQCINFCIKYQLAATNVEEHDGATATATPEVIRQVV
ncbi:unnamed protein product [Urochloa humidicola]